MKRVHRMLGLTLIAAVLGGAFAYTAWVEGYLAKAERAEQAEAHKRIFDFGRVDVKRGEIVAGDRKLAFAHDPETGWVLTEPVQGPADQGAVAQAIDQMAGIKADGTVSDSATKEELAEYGFSAPTLRMKVELDGGSTRELLVGGKHPLGRAWFISDGKRIAAAGDTFYASLDRELHAFRSKQVFPVSAGRIEAVRVEKGGAQAYVLQRENDRWYVEGPDQKRAEADPALMDRFLLILTRDLKAESYATDGFDPRQGEQYGLEKPRFTIEVKTDSGRTHRAALGRSVEGGPYVHILGTGTVVAVYESFAGDVDKSASAFRDRTLAVFDPKEAKRVELELGGARIVVEKQAVDAGESWRIVSPSQAKAKAWKISALLFQLSRLRSDEIREERVSATRLAEMRLDPPRARIAVENENGEKLADIRIGKNYDEYNVFITAAGLERVDAIEEKRLIFLPKDMSEILDSR